jgi:hypothetical protein
MKFGYNHIYFVCVEFHTLDTESSFLCGKIHFIFKKALAIYFKEKICEFAIFRL